MISWIRAWWRSFGHAWRGFRWALRSQRNLQIHLAATALVVVAGVIKPLQSWQWACLLLTIALVWTAELLNTAIEVLCDRITQNQDELIGRIKDVASAAVLASSSAAIIMAYILFF